LLVALAAALFGSVLAPVAAAGAQGFSATPSDSEPYAVCARATPGHAACLAILVPTSSARSLSTPSPAVSPLLSQAYFGSGVGGGYDPADLRSAYDLPSESSGAGQTVAIVDAYDDPNAESDLATYRSHYGLPACTAANGCFKKVNQSGGSSYPAANASWAVEISLDLDMASASCPNCHILLVEASSNSSSNLYAAEDEAVALGATEISNSWASEEFPGETADDSYFNHPGVPITAAAGDSGYGVGYPAASGDVIAVGGTSLVQAANSRGWTESAWSGSGSGCSAYEPKPAWQTDAGCVRRTDNDVAAVASPASPVSVADSYKLPSEFSKPEAGWTLVAGTSVSSPLVAGMMALANAYTRSFPGAQALYEEAAQNGTGVLDDVVSGSDGSCGSYLCVAAGGYDGPTGLGSISGAPVVLASQGASTFGKSSVGASSEGDPANLKAVSKYALGTSGSVSKLSIYLQPAATAGEQKFQGVIYADASGAPGALLATSSPLTFKSTSAAGWYELPFSAPPKLAPGSYWLGWISGSTSGVAAFRYTSTAAAMDYNTNTFTSGPSNPFGSPTVASRQPSLYATYVAGAAPVAPVNNSPLTISGTAESGQTLTAAPGSWTESPSSYAYEWELCNSEGASCSAISGAKSQTYLLIPADAGETLRVSVIASNDGVLSAAKSSAQTAVIAQGPANFGKTSIGSSAEMDPANLKGVSKYALPIAASVSRLSIYLQPTGTAGEEKFEGVVYGESSGAPGALLGSTVALTFKNTNAAGWYELPFPTSLKLGAGNYWLGWISGGTSAIAAFRYESVTSALYYNSNLFTSGPANPFGTPTKLNLAPSLYATYVAE
jgi:hypothetical protein